MCVCTVVLRVSRIVVESNVDAVVNMAMTKLPFSRLQSLKVKEIPGECA